MKTAKVGRRVIYGIMCPHCETEQDNHDGSLMWFEEEFEHIPTMKCQRCDETFKMPAKRRPRAAKAA
jgi:Zn ribbon nucleic-acid-binding protein